MTIAVCTVYVHGHGPSLIAVVCTVHVHSHGPSQTAVVCTMHVNLGNKKISTVVYQLDTCTYIGAILFI